jgi:hypothetical protein
MRKTHEILSRKTTMMFQNKSSPILTFFISIQDFGNMEKELGVADLVFQLSEKM